MNKNCKILLSFFRTPVEAHSMFYFDEFDKDDVYTSINVPENIMNIIENVMNDKFQIIWDESRSETDYFQYNFLIDPKRKELKLWMDGEFYRSEDDLTRGQITNQEFQNKCNELGIKKIVAKYNGGGDSGYLEEIFFDDNEVNQVNHVPNIIENELYDLLEYKFSGWEIDEGSNGKITINDNFDYEINHRWWTRVFERTTPFYNLITEKFENEK